MARQVAWNEYEGALLLDAYLKVLRGEKPRMDSIKECSAQLRQMALNAGEHIDDIYRNVNGISFQMSSMESAYQGHTIMKPATRLFTKMVVLYRNNPERFQILLMEAKAMANEKGNKEAAFMSWLSENVSETQLSELYMALHEIDNQAKKDKLVRSSLYESNDPAHIKRIKSGIEGNRFFRFTHKRQWGRILSALNYLLKYAVQESTLQTTITADDVTSEGIREQKESAPIYVEKVHDEREWGKDLQEIDASKLSGLSGDEVVLNFENIGKIAFSKPVSLSYFGEVKQETTWKGVYVDACKYLLDEYPHVFEKLKEESLNGSIKTWLVDESHLQLLAAPKKVLDGYYVETNRSASDLVKKLKWILDECAVDYGNVVILYLRGDGEKSFSNVPIADMLPSQKKSTSRANRESFLHWLKEEQHMAEGTCRSYVSAIESAEQFAEQHGFLSHKLYAVSAEEAKATADELFANSEFIQKNKEQHNRFRTAITKLLTYYGSELPHQTEVRRNDTVDERWIPILRDSFPDGYILDDFLCQFQAGAFWQERYSETCPIEGTAIDEAMKAVGTIRDNRIFEKKEEDTELISNICNEINSILSSYSAVYRMNIYNRYQEKLATCQIYTEAVMTQQLLRNANRRFYSYYQLFAKQGQEASVTQDARKVLRNHGGAMPVADVANELWFVPYDIVYHCLAVDDEAISIGNSIWMLAENFPLTKDDARLVGDMLDECFLSQTFVKAQELIPLLKRHLPSVAENLSGFHFTAVFNILSYYLKDRFSFSRAIISPIGAKTEFRDLFIEFAKEHERFSLDELSAFAKELNVPIYWKSTFNGGAVRISRTEFVNQSQVSFDVEETDAVLESFCTGDYLPLQEVSSAMMMHLPPCGYRWNGYLLLSYLYGHSKTFRLSYNSLGKSGYYGALVRRSCTEIDSYERLVEQVLIQDKTWHTETEALNVLISKGLQAQRRLKGIEQIVAKVKHSGNNEEGG